jgi:hypothetical protein
MDSRQSSLYLKTTLTLSRSVPYAFHATMTRFKTILQICAVPCETSGSTWMVSYRNDGERVPSSVIEAGCR